MKKISFLISVLGLMLFLSSCFKNKGSEFDEPDYVEPDIAYDKAVFTKGATVLYKIDGENALEFRVGDLKSPVILSSPHDGIFEPAGVDDRDHPDGEIVRDIYATPLVVRVADTLEKRTGMRPHIIINQISRKKLDPNRSRDESYLTSYKMLDAYVQYHQYIKIARQIVKDNIGKGLYIDMHGHGHDKDRIEVGYMLAIADLNDTLTNKYLDLKAGKSSIYGIAKTSDYTFSDLVRGDVAFGTLLANELLPAVPSNRVGNKGPAADNYFNGGYCTLAYGSIAGGNISAIQLETDWKHARKDTYDADLKAFPQQFGGGGIARAIIKYFRLHFGMDMEK
ncbi:N-formylglutamate amidohydrolase [Pedobacter sp. MC2016-14]|uniref:N-formylglutamate amidohydrolase n=1 Tax=Pedobacter sp. MC2016-14 TaxID=2897327 RepID=UPI001E34AF1C|nr:N-formylglutamate amidohydrolase [Pedobacter sp. MC2016-14]MCD0488589.1 N-formylglutamate amidohydrolase [Pedobacter sp. MC2016-14]